MQNCFPVSYPAFAFILTSSSSSWPTFNCVSSHSKVLSTELLLGLLCVILCLGFILLWVFPSSICMSNRKKTNFVSLVCGQYCIQKHLYIAPHTRHRHTDTQHPPPHPRPLCCCIVLLVTLPLVAPGELLNALCWALYDLLDLTSACCRMWSFCNCKCTFSTIKSCLFCRKLWDPMCPLSKYKLLFLLNFHAFCLM